MRQAKLFSLFVFSFLMIYGAIGFLSLPLASFEGDLTRMGMLPERMFGWTSPQPVPDIRWLKQSKLEEADVLVIGDSFSVDRIWQSILTKEGLLVHTKHWHEILGICGDFEKRLREQGFKGKHIVIQIVERNLVKYVSRSIACPNAKFRASRDDDNPHPAPPASFERERGDYGGKMSIGLRTWLNMISYEKLTSSPDFKSRKINKDVLLARVEKGCQLFSHHQCTEALFLTWDQVDNDIADSTIVEMTEINQRLDRLNIVWAVVPNKTTAYLNPDKKFWNLAEQRLNSPNLLLMVRRAIDNKTMDLYPGNNTHLSTTGYLLMGQAIRDSLRQAH